MGEFVRLEVEDGVGTSRIDRPKMNALDAQVEGQDMQVQQLLIPVTFFADAIEVGTVEENQETLKALGFDIAAISPTTAVWCAWWIPEPSWATRRRAWTRTIRRAGCTRV